MANRKLILDKHTKDDMVCAIDLINFSKAAKLFGLNRGSFRADRKIPAIAQSQMAKLEKYLERWMKETEEIVNSQK